MYKIAIISFFFFLSCRSLYSQQEDNRIKILPVSENCISKNSCEILNFRYPFFILYCCSREKNIYTSFVQDTLVALFEIKICFHFITDLTYITIKEIGELTAEMFLHEKEREYIDEVIFQIMQNSKFYYEGREDELNEKSFYMNMPFKFIPCKPRRKIKTP